MSVKIEGNRVKVYNENGELVQEREATLEDLEGIIRGRIIELWSYPPFRDIVGVDTSESSEVNTLDWSTLKSYRYTARRDLQSFKLRIRTGVQMRNTDSEPQTVELSALVNNEVIVYLGSLTVDANTTLEDFVDVTAEVDIANASRDISVDLRAKTSSDKCYVSLTPPILVEIGYLLSPRQKYRRVGDKRMVIPESILAEMEKEEIARMVLKKLEEEYEMEISIDPRTGKGSAKVKKRGKT
jgi:hypothetical protein